MHVDPFEARVDPSKERVESIERGVDPIPVYGDLLILPSGWVSRKVW